MTGLDAVLKHGQAPYSISPHAHVHARMHARARPAMHTHTH